MPLLSDLRARKLDTVVVYKVDRLTRSLADFAKIVEVLDTHGVSFVSVTQQFNTPARWGASRSPPTNSKPRPCAQVRRVKEDGRVSGRAQSEARAATRDHLPLPRRSCRPAASGYAGRPVRPHQKDAMKS
jgi:hypothetical protein